MTNEERATEYAAGMKDAHKYYQDLNEKEQEKVRNEIDKLLEVIRNKRTKWHHGSTNK